MLSNAGEALYLVLSVNDAFLQQLQHSNSEVRCVTTGMSKRSCVSIVNVDIIFNTFEDVWNLIRREANDILSVQGRIIGTIARSGCPAIAEHYTRALLCKCGVAKEGNNCCRARVSIVLPGKFPREIPWQSECVLAICVLASEVRVELH